MNITETLPRPKTTVTELENDNWKIEMDYNGKIYERHFSDKKFICKFVKTSDIKNIIEGTFKSPRLNYEVEYLLSSDNKDCEIEYLLSLDKINKENDKDIDRRCEIEYLLSDCNKENDKEFLMIIFKMIWKIKDVTLYDNQYLKLFKEYKTEAIITKIENNGWYKIEVIHNGDIYETRIHDKEFICKFIEIPQIKNIIEGTVTDLKYKVEYEEIKSTIKYSYIKNILIKLEMSKLENPADIDTQFLLLSQVK